MSSLIPAVLVDARAPVALDVVRTLGRRGVPVIGVFGGGVPSGLYEPMVRASRYLREAVSAGDDCMGALQQLGRRLPQRAVLIPLGDASMLAISRQRAALEPYYLLRMPSQKMIETLLDKNHFASFAAGLGLLVPATLPVASEAALDQAAQVMRFPCIVKPPWRDHRWTQAYGRNKVRFAGNPAELLARGREVLSLCGHCIVQEIVPGPEVNILCSFAFLDEKSEPVTLSVCRKLRQFPPYFGNTAMAEIIEQPEVAQATREICGKLGLVGYVSIEFKRDPATGRLLILEITPSRINRQAAVTELAAHSIVAAWYCSLTGRMPDDRRGLRTGLRWVSPINDLRSLPTYLRDRNWSLHAWLGSYARVRCCETLSLRDPLPWLVGLGTLARLWWRRH
jgi:D-aspartate ligase